MDHYDRRRRHGSPTAPRSRRGDPEFNFWAKVDKDGPLPEHYPELGPCWVWTGAKNQKGYGMFAARSSFGRPSMAAHRWIWLWSVGDLDNGLVIDHLCRNHECVRVSHLEPVTAGDNSLRGETFAADNIIKTHCKWGHVLTPDNLYPVRGHPTRRHCRPCALNRSRGLNGDGSPR